MYKIIYNNINVYWYCDESPNFDIMISIVSVMVSFITICLSFLLITSYNHFQKVDTRRRNGETISTREAFISLFIEDEPDKCDKVLELLESDVVRSRRKKITNSIELVIRIVIKD